MMHQPVDHRRRHDGIAEDLTPGREGLVGGDDHRAALIAGGHQLEEQVGGLGVEGDVADLVDDDERGALQQPQVVLQPILMVGGRQLRDPLGGCGKLDPIPGQAGLEPQGDRQVGLSGAGWAEEDHILAGR